MSRRPPTRLLWSLPPLVLLGGFLLYPLALVLRQSFVDGSGRWTLATWRQLAGGAEFRTALLHTVQIAVAATAGCLLLGFFFAVVLAFVPFPGARLVSRLVDVLLAVPSFLIALAFTFLYGTAGVLAAAGVPTGSFLYSAWCVILAEITFYTPFVLRPLLACFARVPAAQLDVAASLGARPGRIVRTVLLPQAWPTLAASGSLTLLLTLNEFGIVLFIGAKNVTTLPMLVQAKATVLFDYPGAAAVAVVEVVTSVALYGIYRVVFARTGAGRAGLVA